MNLSKQTMAILANFSTINQSILVKPGKELRTISPQKTIAAIAKIDDEFDNRMCIYDTSRFLAMCSLYSEPVLTIEDKACIISEKGSNREKKTRYVFADESMIIAAPEKEVKIPSEDVKVNITWSDLDSVIKASSVLKLPEVAFVGENGKCYLKAIDSSNPTADNYGIELGETEDTFQLILKTENLKLLAGDYTVTLCSKGISKFESDRIRYYIVVESKSSYNKG